MCQKCQVCVTRLPDSGYHSGFRCLVVGRKMNKPEIKSL